MSYQKVTNYQSNKENPFLKDTVSHVIKGEKKIMMGSGKDTDLVVGINGEIKGHSVFLKRTTIDKAQFAKVYVSNLVQFFGLSKAGIRVFGYIASTVKPDKDFVIMDFDECMDFTKYKSQKSILTGISELLKNSFIARGKNPYHYFINPTIFFNGNRITFLKQYQVNNNNIESITK